MGPLSGTLIAWTAGVACASAQAILAPRPARAPIGAPSRRDVLLARAVTGDDAALGRALASLPTYLGGALAIRVGVESTTDGAYDVARAACSALAAAGHDARVVVTGARGPNAKADQLARIVAAEAKAPDVVVVADGCVDLAGLSLDELLAPLADPAVGAVWAAPIEIAPTTLADRASAAVLDASLHAFSLLARLDPRGMVGKLCAIRGETLASVGGFGALVDVLGEDMELARRLDALGLATVVSTVQARSLAGGRSFGEVVARYARWIAVIRAQRPHLLPSYPLLLAATPLLAGFALVATAIEGAPALVVLAAAVAARVAVTIAARRASGRSIDLRALVVDAPLADLVLLLAFARAVGTRELVWRGRGLRVGADGALTARSAGGSAPAIVATRGPS